MIKYSGKLKLLFFVSCFFCFFMVWSGPVMAKTYKVNVSAVKSGRNRINFHNMLPRKYRSPYHVMQGAATDGKYIYLNYWKADSRKCVMVKLNARSFKRVKVSKPLRIHHGNDMAYNPSTGLLYTVYSSDNPFEVTMVNPRTLTVCGTKTIVLPETLPGSAGIKMKKISGLVGITYNEKRNQFAMRVGDSNDFIIFDAAFNPLRYVNVKVDTRLRRQCLNSDDDRVYVCVDRVGHYNKIMVYGWDGQFYHTLRVPLSYEIEGMYHYKNKVYGTFYSSQGPGSYIYRIYMK